MIDPAVLGLGLPLVVGAAALGPRVLLGRRPAAGGAAPPATPGAVAEATPAPGVADHAWTALGVGLAATAGLVGAHGWPGTSPDLEGWLVYVGLAGTTLAVALARWSGAVVRWPLLGLASAGVAGLMLRPLLPGFSTGEAAAWLTGSTALSVLLAVALDVAARRPRAWGWFALGAHTALVGAALAVGRSALLGLLAGTIGVALGVAFLAALRGGDRVPARAAAPLVAPLLAGLLLRSRAYADLPLASVALLVVAPAATGLAGPLARRLGSRWAEVAGLAVTLALAAGAVALAFPLADAGPAY